MARQVANKIYRNSSRGLITEASELTYPENSSIAEDNCVIFKKGNRTRRLGFAIEQSGSPSVFNGLGDPAWAIKEFRWDSAAKRSDKNFVVQQYGNMLYFFDQASEPLSAGFKSFTIDLNNYLAPNRAGTSTVEVEGSFGGGYLLGGRQEARIQIVEKEKKVIEYVDRIREVQVRNYEVEKQLQERVRLANERTSTLQSRLDSIVYPDCAAVNYDVVRVFNEAVADHPGADASNVPDPEVTGVTLRDVDKHHLEAIARYNALSLRHDALVDWVEREIINGSR